MSWENARCHLEKPSVNGQPRALLNLTVGLVEIVTDIGKVFDNRFSRNRSIHRESKSNRYSLSSNPILT